MALPLRSIWSHQRRNGSEDSEMLFHPGAPAPRSGLYWVSHLRHRLAHLVFVEEGAIFPHCRRCGSGVRFSLQQRVHRVDSDRDFSRRPRLLALDKEQRKVKTIKTKEKGD